MASLFSSVVVPLVLISSSNFHTITNIHSEAVPLYRRCSAQTAGEGETAVLEFPLPQDVALKPVFLTIRRSQKTEHNIVHCERNSPLECTFKHPADKQTSGIENNTLMLHIPNVTKELEDVYTLKIYINGILQPTDSCQLSVKTKLASQKCSAPNVMEGDTGVITFFVKKDETMSSATLIRNGYQGEILSCRREKPSSQLECGIHDQRFTTTGVAQQGLTVLIPNMTKEFEGIYTIRILFNDVDELLESCNLQVKDAQVETSVGSAKIDNSVLNLFGVLLGCIALFLLFLLVILLHRYRCIHQLNHCALPWVLKADNNDDATSTLLRKETFIFEASQPPFCKYQCRRTD